MKFRLVESLELLDNGIYIADTEYSIKTFMLNKLNNFDFIRAIYDPDNDAYYWADANLYIHQDILNNVQKQGYLYKLEDNPKYNDFKYNNGSFNIYDLTSQADWALFSICSLDKCTKSILSGWKEIDYYDKFLKFPQHNLIIATDSSNIFDVPFIKLLGKYELK